MSDSIDFASGFQEVSFDIAGDQFVVIAVGRNGTALVRLSVADAQRLRDWLIDRLPEHPSVPAGAMEVRE